MRRPVLPLIALVGAAALTGCGPRRGAGAETAEATDPRAAPAAPAAPTAPPPQAAAPVAAHEFGNLQTARAAQAAMTRAGAALSGDLAPAGLAVASIGRKLSEVRADLLAKGYEERRDCRFGKGPDDAGVSIRLFTQSRARCVPEAPVGAANVEDLRSGANTAPPQLLKRVREALGAQPTQCREVAPDEVECSWTPPDAPPLARSLSFEADHKPEGGGWALNVIGIPQLAFRPGWQKVVADADQPDPTRLFGVRLGMTPAQAAVALKAAGLSGDGPATADGPCSYSQIVDDVQQRIAFSTGNMNDRACRAGQPITWIQVANHPFEGRPGDYLAYAERRLGARSQACGASAAEFQGCKWTDPPKAPQVAALSLSGEPGDFGKPGQLSAELRSAGALPQ